MTEDERKLSDLLPKAGLDKFNKSVENGLFAFYKANKSIFEDFEKTLYGHLNASLAPKTIDFIKTLNAALLVQVIAFKSIWMARQAESATNLDNKFMTVIHSFFKAPGVGRAFVNKHKDKILADKSFVRSFSPRFVFADSFFPINRVKSTRSPF